MSKSSTYSLRQVTGNYVETQQLKSTLYRSFVTEKLLLLLMILSLFSCRVVLVPEYRSDLEDQIISGAKLNDKLYIDLLQSDKQMRQFDLYKEQYAIIAAEINSIQLKNEVRNNNANMLVIIKNLNDAFTKYRDEHKSTNTISDGEIKIDQAYLKAFWKPLLVAETALKNTRN
jgi:hypothetical protein